MSTRTLKITINGTGFAGDYTTRVYGMIPHKNGVRIELAGVTSGRLENAERFASDHGIARAFSSHVEMLQAVAPDIDNIACANYAHGRYATEAVASFASTVTMRLAVITCLLLTVFLLFLIF